MKRKKKNEKICSFEGFNGKNVLDFYDKDIEEKIIALEKEEEKLLKIEEGEDKIWAKD